MVKVLNTIIRGVYSKKYPKMFSPWYASNHIENIRGQFPEIDKQLNHHHQSL